MNRKCSKCGGSAFIQHQSWVPGTAIPHDRILRTCERCGYRWEELPLDFDAERELELLMRIREAECAS